MFEFSWKYAIPENSDFTSIPLKEITDYINRKNDVFTNDEIFEILNLLYPYLDNEHLANISIKNIKFRGFMAKTKKFFKGKSSDNLLGRELLEREDNEIIESVEKTHYIPCPQCNVKLKVSESTIKCICPECGFEADFA